MSYSEFFDDRRKHLQKEKEEKFFNLFIPCYDVLNKEIYFFNFFNEEIVDMKSIDLSSKEVYTILMNHVRDDADKTVNLLWFDDVTIENMAKSFGVFLESMNYEEEE